MAFGSVFWHSEEFELDFNTCIDCPVPTLERTNMINPSTNLNQCQVCGSADVNLEGRIVTVANSAMSVANVVRCRDCDVVSYWNEKLRLMIGSKMKR
jgi:hypothetical protein